MKKTREWRRKKQAVRKRGKYLRRKRRKAAQSPSQTPINYNSVERIESFGPLNPGDPFVMEAPAHFSLINNCEQTLMYFHACKQKMREKYEIFIDCKGVEKLTPDAIAVLVASLEDKDFRSGMTTHGRAPEDKKLLKMMVGSGFYEYVMHNIPNYRKPTQHSLIHVETRSKVENEIAKKQGEEAVLHTFGTSERFLPVYKILIECMGNTNNHAGLGKQGRYDWWLFRYDDPETGVTSFTFLDLGIGIFKSINKRKISELIESVGFGNNVGYAHRLFAGEIPSRTGRKDRGKGWPSIHNIVKETREIQNFTLISNDIYATIDSQSETSIKRMNTGFRGTLIYWEIHPRV